MIPGGMFPKKTIVIRGMVPYGADGCVFVHAHPEISIICECKHTHTYYNIPSLCCRIKINFVVSRSQDIALHINPRVKDEVVVRNSLIGGDWGQEETELSMNPFTEGQYFDVSGIYVLMNN